MKTKWIDFKALREQLNFEDVLKHYGVEIKCKGNQHRGYCPLPNHNGKKNSPSFSANLTKGIFQCFGCGAKGNILDFATLMSGANPKDGDALRKVAGELQERFSSDSKSTPRPKERESVHHVENQKPTERDESEIVVNVSLDFTLKDLDSRHPYLLGRGFSQSTIEYFGLGYCSRGMLKYRVAIPLHDAKGDLVGYAGRVVDEGTISEDNPRYRFPGERKRDGKVYEFRKTLFVYNGFRIQRPVNDLTVVEGFTGVWWLTQNDFPDTIATMGADCSEKQAELIVSLVNPGGTVWIMPDGDKAGERHAQQLLMHISPYHLIRWLKLPEGKQPTDLTKEELKLKYVS